MTSNGRRTDGQSGGAQLARGLGLFSLGLGTAEVAVPQVIAHLIGVEDDARTRRLLRAMGARELASAFAILARPQHPAPVWSRVAGDALDLTLLSLVGARHRTDGARLALAFGAVVGVAVLDVLTATKLQRSHEAGRRPVKKSVTINQPPAEVYRRWRDLEQLPQFMTYLESVRELSETRSRWTAKLPAGGTVSWEAVITEDEPGRRLAWRSVEGARVSTRGTVRFEPTLDGQGTELHVELEVLPLGGHLGEGLAGRVAAAQVAGDLRRFKQVVETGGVVHSNASAHGGLTHPARPSKSPPAASVTPAREGVTL